MRAIHPLKRTNDEMAKLLEIARSGGFSDERPTLAPSFAQLLVRWKWAWMGGALAWVLIIAALAGCAAPLACSDAGYAAAVAPHAGYPAAAGDAAITQWVECLP